MISMIMLKTTFHPHHTWKDVSTPSSSYKEIIIGGECFTVSTYIESLNESINTSLVNRDDKAKQAEVHSVDVHGDDVSLAVWDLVESFTFSGTTIVFVL